MTHSLEGLLIGRTLADRYVIEEVIGRGGMSVVYRAADQRLGRPVAVKIVSLPAEGAERSELRARLRREAASAARIPAHPNVVHVYDYGTDPELDLDFIVMELLTGRDLKAAMAAGSVGAAESVRVLREAARGIAAGHRAGIIHRDVKPGNIFLAGAERFELVKILDFGIAKALETEGEDDLTRTGVVPHSPAYASPEQLDPDRPVTAASDVYQLGLVGYELLAGERPFTEAERERIRAGEDVPLPERAAWSRVSDDLRETIVRALRPLAADRFADAAALAEALGVVTDPVHPASQGPAGEDDATLAMAAATPAPEPMHGEDTALADEAIPQLAGAHTARPRAARPTLGGLLPGRLPGRGVQLAGAAVLALLGLWAISRLGGDSPAAEPAATAALLDTRELDEEFRPLIADAAAAGGAEAPADGEEAVDDVRRVIVEMNDAWVQGDLDRHLAHYADQVRFYGERSASRGFIARERGDALERYSDREITIDRTAITFPEPGRAIALVDKTWRFAGEDGAEFEGAARQELILELRQGVWQVVSEQDVEVYEVNREG